MKRKHAFDIGVLLGLIIIAIFVFHINEYHDYRAKQWDVAFCIIAPILYIIFMIKDWRR